MRLLVISDMAATGFGRVGRELSRRFLDAGLDIRIIAVNWRGPIGEVLALMQKDGTTEQVKALLDELDADRLTPLMFSPFMGAPNDGLGKLITQAAAEGNLPAWPGWRADAIFVVADPRLMFERLAYGGGIFETLPSWNYVPIEGGELPPFWRMFWDRVQPVAMSEFGAAELGKVLGRPVPFVPHGVSEAFYQVSTTRPGHYRGDPVASKDAAKMRLWMAGRPVLLRPDPLLPRKS